MQTDNLFFDQNLKYSTCSLTLTNIFHDDVALGGEEKLTKHVLLIVNKNQISIKNDIHFSFVVALTHDREIANLTKRTQDETDDGSQGQQGLFVHCVVSQIL